jgi:hypothetical protein
VGYEPQRVGDVCVRQSAAIPFVIQEGVHPLWRKGCMRVHPPGRPRSEEISEYLLLLPGLFQANRLLWTALVLLETYIYHDL